MGEGKFDKDRDAWCHAYLSNLVAECGNNVSKAARIAGRNRTDFYKMLVRYDVKHKKEIKSLVYYDMRAFLGGKKREAPKPATAEPCQCSACLMAAPWLCASKEST